jgi:hypothetical protein
MSDKLDAFRGGAANSKGVCPQPQAWQALWEMLPEKTRRGAGWEPPVPLILAGWSYSSDAEKSERFQLHLDWASSHGQADKIFGFLNSLTSEDWYSA